MDWLCVNWMVTVGARTRAFWGQLVGRVNVPPEGSDVETTRKVVVGAGVGVGTWSGVGEGDWHEAQTRRMRADKIGFRMPFDQQKRCHAWVGLPDPGESLFEVTNV